MKFNKKIFILNFTILILLYIFSLYNIIFWFDSIHSFWWIQIIIYSIINIFLLFIFLYFLSNLWKKWIFIKLLIIFSYLILSSSFWYKFNSFPIIQNVKITNNTWENIEVVIPPIFKFDNELKANLENNQELQFLLFWGWEYNILWDKEFEVKWFNKWKNIYFNLHILI